MYWPLRVPGAGRTAICQETPLKPRQGRLPLDPAGKYLDLKVPNAPTVLP